MERQILFLKDFEKLVADNLSEEVDKKISVDVDITLENYFKI